MKNQIRIIRHLRNSYKPEEETKIKRKWTLEETEIIQGTEKVNEGKKGREDGSKEGREDGRKEGRKEGRREGRKERRKEGRREGGRKEGRKDR